MNRTWRITVPLLALGLAGGIFLAGRDSEPMVQEVPPLLTHEETNAPAPSRRIPAPEPQDLVTEAVLEAEPPPSVVAQPPVVRYSAEELKEVLPLWMREEAEVDAHAENLTVAGTPVSRVRGRYAWPNGSGMEVEISDLGAAPSDLLLRSLGYNTTMTDTETDAGFSMHVDVTNSPGTFEYDYATGEGGLLVLVADRFLVEVQLELLPLESFDAVIQHQVPMAKLEEMAARAESALQD